MRIQRVLWRWSRQGWKNWKIRTTKRDRAEWGILDETCAEGTTLGACLDWFLCLASCNTFVPDCAIGSKRATGLSNTIHCLFLRARYPGQKHSWLETSNAFFTLPDKNSYRANFSCQFAFHLVRRNGISFQNWRKWKKNSN